MHETKDVIIGTLKYVSGKTLDLGAGTAKYSGFIKQKAKEYVTFDAVAGKNIDIVGDVLNLPIGNETFDTVISTQVLEHVEKPWIMVKEIRRILKEGGICILTAPFLSPYHSDPRDYFRYTEDGLKSLFSNEGFEILECSGYGKVFSVLSGFVKFSWFNPYKKRMRGSWKMTRFISSFAKFLDKFVNSKIIYGNVYIVAKK